MGEASRLIHVVSISDVMPDVGVVAALKVALERVENDYLARVMWRRERMGELGASVPSEEALSKMGGER